MKQFPISVVNKEAVYTADDCIVCGNNDYEIVFSFDAEWDEHTVKTCRFVCNGKHTDVVFSGNVCPGVIIDNARVVSIGVFTGELKTTTPAIVGCKKSILCGTDLPADPLPDVYTQLIKTINEKLNVEEVLDAALEEAKESGEFDGKDGADGKDGLNGKTPRIGENGNWWIGETDTGEKAVGTDGVNGKDGKDGVDGYTPQKGVDYFTPEDIAELDARNDWVKIMCKTLTADEAGISRINISKDGEGNEFSLKKIYVDIQSPSGYEAAADFSVYLNRDYSAGGCLCYFSSSTNDKYITAVAERIDDGLWEAKYYNGSTTYYRRHTSSYYVSAIDHISVIEIQRSKLQEGTRIRVYGVKA